MSAPASLVETIVERTCALGAVPAPPLHEGDRAALVAQWWSAEGLAEVGIDDAGNVLARVRDGDRPGVVVCAHLDTVFGTEVEHRIERDGDLLRGPGVGDDTVAVAALAALDALLSHEMPRPVWIAATVGEEGVGNLTGVRALLADPDRDIGALVAVEGNYLGRVCVAGVGSVRWRVRLSGPGGHAWEQADAPSAVHAAAAAITALDRLPHVPGRVAVNVGTLAGGEAINARARAATFAADLRAVSGRELDLLARKARRAIEGALPSGIEARFELLGRRPAGEIDHDHPLVRAACQALEGVGRAWRLTAASTDANAAHAIGLPAITVGVTEGADEHTPQEWIRVSPLADGLAALADTIVRYAEEES